MNDCMANVMNIRTILRQCGFRNRDEAIRVAHKFGKVEHKMTIDEFTRREYFEQTGNEFPLTV